MTDPKDNNWTIPDLIDFELWVREGAQIADAKKAEYRKENRKLCSVVDGEERRYYFRRWVLAKRTLLHSHSESDGIIAYSWFTTSAWIMGLLGALLAFSMVAAFFSGFLGGTGESSPINVVDFAVVCILLPFLLTIGALVVWLAGFRQYPGVRPPALLRSLPWFLIKIPLAHTIRHPGDSVNSRTKLRAAGLMGGLKSLLTSRKSLLSSYAALWIQALGVGYAIALPLAIFWQNATSSQDYNWETNFDNTITPEHFQSIVSGVSIPWAWWKGPADGVPSLAQIMATKHVKYSFQSSEPAHAWGVWGTFLLLASTTYVTVPRLAIYALSLHASHKRLKQETFDEARFDELAESLRTPATSWKGPQDTPVLPSLHDGDGDDGAPPRPTGRACFIAIPEDINSENLFRTARHNLEKLRGLQCMNVDPLVLPSNPTKFQEILENLPNLVSRSGDTRFVLIKDAGEPPVLHQIRRLQSIRKQLGQKVGIVVAMLGPVSADPLGDPPASADLEAWKLKIQAIGDPDIRVITFHSDPS